MSEEIVDIFSARGEPLGRKSRTLVHRDGDWHRVFHCWVFFVDPGGNHTVLLQRRSRNVRNYPGLLDVSAAGHYSAGEDLAAGLRELREEIGIEVGWSALVPAGVRINVDEWVDGRKDREIQHIFFLRGSARLTDYRIQEEELDGLVSASIADMLDLFAGDRGEISGLGYSTDGKSGRLDSEPKEIAIDRSDFVRSIDDYPYRVMIQGERFLGGERHLRV